jgi:hypothetical protein
VFRDREHAPGHRSRDTSARPGRRATNPVLALQQTIGNRAVGQILAREPSTKSTIQIGKLAIVVAGGNIAAWPNTPSDKLPETLEVTSQKGKHSAELEQLSKERTRIKSITLTVAAGNTSGQISVASDAIEFTNARIKRYVVDGKTESWLVVDFDRVNRTKTTPKKPKP